MLTWVNEDPSDSCNDCASASCLPDGLIMREALAAGNGSIFVDVPTTCIASATAQLMVIPSQMKSHGSAADLQKLDVLRSYLISPLAFTWAYVSPFFNIEWVRKLVSKRRIPKSKIN